MKCQFSIQFFSDDDKTKLLYKKNFKSCDEIIKDGFNISKSFLYKCTSSKYKHNSSDKFKRMRIIKTTFYNNREDKISVFG
tara:strand:- start:1492 stop:1734 length:243 start_codon:yes stop_codon:yes gene_type:complete